LIPEGLKRDEELSLVTFKIWKFLDQMVEALGIIIDRSPKGRPRKNIFINYSKKKRIFSVFIEYM